MSRRNLPDDPGADRYHVVMSGTNDPVGGDRDLERVMQPSSVDHDAGGCAGVVIEKLVPAVSTCDVGLTDQVSTDAPEDPNERPRIPAARKRGPGPVVAHAVGDFRGGMANGNIDVGAYGGVPAEKVAQTEVELGCQLKTGQAVPVTESCITDSMTEIDVRARTYFPPSGESITYARTRTQVVTIDKVAKVRMDPQPQIALAHRVGQMTGKNLLDPNFFVAARVDSRRYSRDECSRQLRADEAREYGKEAETWSDAVR